ESAAGWRQGVFVTIVYNSPILIVQIDVMHDLPWTYIEDQYNLNNCRIFFLFAYRHQFFMMELSNLARA
ncbi:MAG: hypothetical protein OXF73_03840, partial [Gammaproteobacteria bacterium]|nr:hypothetical protein [Gammaproteobacteria bacterium]